MPQGNSNVQIDLRNHVDQVSKFGPQLQREGDKKIRKKVPHASTWFIDDPFCLFSRDDSGICSMNE